MPAAPGPQCLQSILASDMIINYMLDRVALDDEQKEVMSRKRAIRLAMAQAWVTASSSNWVSVYLFNEL